MLDLGRFLAGGVLEVGSLVATAFEVDAFVAFALEVVPLLAVVLEVEALRPGAPDSANNRTPSPPPSLSSSSISSPPSSSSGTMVVGWMREKNKRERGPVTPLQQETTRKRCKPNRRKADLVNILWRGFMGFWHLHLRARDGINLGGSGLLTSDGNMQLASLHL